LKYLAILFLSIYLFANSTSTDFKKYKDVLKSGSKSEIFKSYNGLKIIYMTALMNDDKDRQKKSLRVLIKTSDKLGINSDNYKDNLKKLVASTAFQKAIVKIDSKLPVLEQFHIDKDGIMVLFSKPISKYDIKNIIWHNKKKSFKSIFDIKAYYPEASTTKKIGDKRYIKIGRYKNDIARIVIEDNSRIKSSFKISGKKLTIFYKTKIIKTAKKSKKIKKSKNKFIAKNKIIVIDAGHGGHDPGAIGTRGIKEKNIVLKTALKTYYVLKSKGYRVYLTRSDDKFIKLTNRTKFANDKKADLFISIHANSVPRRSKRSKAYGIETYFLSPTKSKRSMRVAEKENLADTEAMNYFSRFTFLNILNKSKIIESNKLSIDVQNGVLRNIQTAYKVKNKGVKKAPFWVLVGATMPSILIEIGYVSHPIEGRRLNSRYYQKLLARGIAEGVDNYFKNSDR
jgi:N-acetylmuramoyl-L-alanine amidase